jgi:ornithine cyclodeaminase/alanine dehydrogenase-like protein (mu-crystallin family)
MGALYLSDADVRALLDVPALLDVVEDTFRMAHAGRVIWPEPRLFRLNLDEPRAKYHVKSAALPDLGVSGVRVVGYHIFPDGSGTSRDDNMRYVLLHDPQSGQPLAIVDEHTSYGVRSAASGVVAARHLARPESSVVGLVGAGKLMRSALVALASVFPGLREVRITSRSAESRAAFARTFADQLPHVRIRPVETPAEASRDADIVMSATTAGQTLLWERDFAPGVFVCGLGQHEVAPDAFAAFDKVVVDDWQQVQELADFRQMADAGTFDHSKLYAELADVITGVVPGRTSPGERILVRTEGLASQDIAVANWLYLAACRAGRGTRLP